MKDLWNAIVKWVDHYRYTFLGILLAAAVLAGTLGVVGCDSSTVSLTDPSKKITREELYREVVVIDTELRLERIEIEAATQKLNEAITKYNAELADAQADLDRQDAVKAKLLEFAATLAMQGATGAINPAVLIPLGVGVLGSILGVGSALDSRRKDKVITAIKSGTAPPA
ncbi:MAG TPA: hypothetical protein VNA25_03920 [Phycisphaerae bacterium]|nr:hypothetical protein [Phycisphaerae bacterium]